MENENDEIMINYLLKNAVIVNEGKKQNGDVYIKEGKIERIGSDITVSEAHELIDLNGAYLLPGCIDDQVHFREPGNPDKEDLESGSRAAILGGITSVFEMPNTNPATDNFERFQDKLNRAKNRMHCNYAFYFGATENNFEFIKKTADLEGCCGIKMFIGSSTGTLLVKKDEAIEEVIRISPRVVSIHSEDDDLLQK